MEVKWQGGFKHVVPCRGYNLGSQIRFTESLEYVDSYDYYECTKEEYELRFFGDGSEFEETTNGRASKAKTQQKNPTKRKPRAKGSEDSKTVRNSSGQPPRATQKKSSGVRKSEVRNVRKPKKDVARTDDTRKASTSGNGTVSSKTRKRTTK
jgi:hypothetical protein